MGETARLIFASGKIVNLATLEPKDWDPQIIQVEERSMVKYYEGQNSGFLGLHTLGPVIKKLREDVPLKAYAPSFVRSAEPLVFLPYMRTGYDGNFDLRRSELFVLNKSQFEQSLAVIAPVVLTDGE